MTSNPLPGAAQRLARLLLVSMVASCGGDREPTPSPASASALAHPDSTQADAARCQANEPQNGLVGWRLDDGTCRRSFLGLTAPAAAVSQAARAPVSALAALPRRITAGELFEWAESQIEYQGFFPSRRQTQTLAPYVYRYYPESTTHLAVAGDRIYVQGPVSGGTLLFVGTLAEFTCRVAPQVCAGVLPCATPSTWTATGRVCKPNDDQPRLLASGNSFTFTDSDGATLGQATYRCNNGVLSNTTLPVCDAAPPKACNTHDLQWAADGNSCSPNAGQPLQLAAGSSFTFRASTGTVGSAAFTCDNGLLLPQGVATCAAPVGTACRPAVNVTWTVAGNTCTAENVPASVASGASYTFIDLSGATAGIAGFSCRSGVLQADAGATCSEDQRQVDSFGGDGGSADGGASGDGSAADGAPIVGGLVRVFDLHGRSTSATTDAQGYYRVRLTGMTPPLLVSVTRPDGKVRRSISLQPLRTNGYIFIAVTGLTDKLVSDVAASAGFTSPAALTPALLERFRNSLASHLAALREHPLVRARLQAAGIDPATFDPLHTPFRPNGRGYDAVLDNLVIDTDDTGATVVRSADCTAPASWTVDNVTCTPDAGEETQIASGTTAVHRDTQGSTRGAVGYSCSKGVLSRPLQASCSTGN